MAEPLGLESKPVRLVPYVARWQAGYVYRGNDGGLPGREFFRRGDRGDPRSHHLHLVEDGGRHWQRYLSFRVALRPDTTLRDATRTQGVSLCACCAVARDER